jgi:hypothetical protein
MNAMKKVGVVGAVLMSKETEGISHSMKREFSCAVIIPLCALNVIKL